MNIFFLLCRGDISGLLLPLFRHNAPLAASVLSKPSCRGGFQLQQVIPVSFIFSIKMSFILAEGQNPFSQGLLEQQKRVAIKRRLTVR